MAQDIEKLEEFFRKCIACDCRECDKNYAALANGVKGAVTEWQAGMVERKQDALAQLSTLTMWCLGMVDAMHKACECTKDAQVNRMHQRVVLDMLVDCCNQLRAQHNLH